MSKPQWIRVVDFCEKNEITTSNLYVQKHNGKLPSSIFKPYGKRELLVDEDFIYRRREFKAQIQHLNQEKFIELTEELSAYAVAKTVCKIVGNNHVAMYNWMIVQMWNRDDSSILKYQVNDMQSKFFRATRHMTVKDIV